MALIERSQSNFILHNDKVVSHVSKMNHSSWILVKADDFTKNNGIFTYSFSGKATVLPTTGQTLIINEYFVRNIELQKKKDY